MPCFDLPLLVQAADGSRESVRVQLSRWMAQGRVIGLRLVRTVQRWLSLAAEEDKGTMTL